MIITKGEISSMLPKPSELDGVKTAFIEAGENGLNFYTNEPPSERLRGSQLLDVTKELTIGGRDAIIAAIKDKADAQEKSAADEDLDRLLNLRRNENEHMGR